MVEFIYTDELSENVNTLEFVMDLFVAADQYNIERLKR
jgi:hypothetical protein